MIDLQANIHDKYTLEFKVGFNTDDTQPLSNANDYVLNTWIFVPNSLDINASKYSKDDFYRDIKSDVRLITPPYSLAELAESDETLPYKSLKQNCISLSKGKGSEDAFVHTVKMYCAIMKSSLREAYHDIANHGTDGDAFVKGEAFLKNAGKAIGRYRNLRKDIAAISVSEKMRNSFDYGDEFLSNTFEKYTFAVRDVLRRRDLEKYKAIENDFRSAIAAEDSYKKERCFLRVELDDKDNNSDYVFRTSLLKKFAESDLYLKANKISNSYFVEQLLFVVAAIIAMLASTLLTLYFQSQFNNYALPLLISVVLIYALKDRLKDWMKSIFSHRVTSKFYDHKTYFRLNDDVIGENMDSFSFVRSDKIPAEVLSIRDRSDLLKAVSFKDERVMLFRKKVRLWRDKLAKASPFPLKGINDVMRFNLTEYTRKMDNTHIPVSGTWEDRGYDVIMGEKRYYINFIMQCVYEGKTEYKRIRLALNRDGIVNIEITQQ